MELIDVGCNLTHDSFDQDREAVLERAREAGVVQLIVTGASEEGSQAAHRLARSHPDVLFATAGVHPHHAADFSDGTAAVIRDLSQQRGVVAVGETGLDYFRDFSPRRQLEIGAESGLPLFLHMRDAHDDFHAILREYRDRLADAVVHCFTGSRKETAISASQAGSATKGGARTCRNISATSLLTAC
jgi:TatD DNase family protein